MREKKQFFIPKNYDKKFEWIPGISGWQHIAFIPIIGLDYFILQHTPFSFSNKFTFILISLGFPWFLMGTHPIRENVPMWKHLLWRMKFLTRQRQFKYKKEGYEYVLEQTEGNSRSEQKREEKTRGSEKISARLNSTQSDRGRILDNSRQQNGDVSESVSN